jgi:hypothetical protein
LRATGSFPVARVGFEKHPEQKELTLGQSKRLIVLASCFTPNEYGLNLPISPRNGPFQLS